MSLSGSFFFIIPNFFTSCRSCHATMRSSKEGAATWNSLKSHYGGKSQRQRGCITSATCGLGSVRGWVDTAAAQDTRFPLTSSARDVPAAGNGFLNEKQSDGNIWQPLMWCSDILHLSARRSRDGKVSIIMKNVIKVLLRLNQLDLSQVHGIDFSLNPRGM